MLSAEYSYESDPRGQREKAREGALRNRIKVSRRQFERGLLAEETAQLLGDSPELVKRVYSYFLVHPEWDNERIVKDMMRNRW